MSKTIQSSRESEEAPPTAPSNDLTTAPIPKLIRRLAIPASVGFLFNTLYNVVDTFWAGRYSTDALAALSLSFPIFFLMLAMGIGFSTGTTALLGNALGAGDRREAARIASQGLILSLLVATVIMAVGYATVPALFRRRQSPWQSADARDSMPLPPAVVS